MTIYAMELGCLEEIKNITSKAMIQDSANIQAAAIGATPMSVENGEASIDIVGVLAPERNSFYDWLGIKQTAYSDIIDQVAMAEADPMVKNIAFNIGSGGGQHMGLIPVMDAIYNSKKPSTARITGMAASAAYMLASQADNIETESDSDLIGSVGTVLNFYVEENVKEITNRDSKDKRPDVTTDHGKSTVEDMLDDVFETVSTRIARGQNVSVDTVKNDYGNGALMTSGKAKELGMIDSIGFSNSSNNIENKTSGISGQKKDLKMETLTELKAQHPDLYASCFNTGVEAGKKEFKAFASGHMKLAEASGDNARAMEDIAAMNDPRDVECTIHHQSVAIKNAQIVARGDESPVVVGEGEAPLEAAHNDDNDKQAKEAKDIFAKMGIEVE